MNITKALSLLTCAFIALTTAINAAERDAKPHGIIKIGKREYIDASTDRINYTVINPFTKAITVRITFRGAKNGGGNLHSFIKPGAQDKNTEFLKKGATFDFDATYEIEN